MYRWEEGPKHDTTKLNFSQYTGLCKYDGMTQLN